MILAFEWRCVWELVVLDIVLPHHVRLAPEGEPKEVNVRWYVPVVFFLMLYFMVE
jgi:hypothetical protein